MPAEIRRQHPMLRMMSRHLARLRDRGIISSTDDLLVIEDAIEVLGKGPVDPMAPIEEIKKCKECGRPLREAKEIVKLADHG